MGTTVTGCGRETIGVFRGCELERDESLIRIIREFDEKSAGHKYGTTEVAYRSSGRNPFVVSDLHLAEGESSSGNYRPTENFFSDCAFARFLDSCRESGFERGDVLVVNGDLVDFTRITCTPRMGDFNCWKDLLQELDIPIPPQGLERTISDRERKLYGLRTDEFKSVWKLELALRGHARFFAVLADWLGAGGEIIIVKGNHDLEWYWPGVRNRLRIWFARHLSAAGRGSAAQMLSSVVLPRLTFVDHSVIIDDAVYVEHGHRFDRYTRVIGDAVLASRPTELNYPYGSFVNRYVLNRLELHFPFVDNVRPRKNVLPVLLRENFPAGLKLLLRTLGFACQMLTKGYFWKTIRDIAGYVVGFAVVLGAVAVTLWIENPVLPKPVDDATYRNAILKFSWGGVKLIAGMFLCYLWSRLMVRLNLKEPAYFTDQQQVRDLTPPTRL